MGMFEQSHSQTSSVDRCSSWQILPKRTMQASVLAHWLRLSERVLAQDIFLDCIAFLKSGKNGAISAVMVAIRL